MIDPKQRAKRSAGSNGWTRRDVVSYCAATTASLALSGAARRALAQAVSFDYYISPTGSDQSAGTLGSPWAITSLQDNNPNQSKIAGKRVGLISGTYNVSGLQSTSDPNDYARGVLSIPAGTVGAVTVVQSVVPRGAVFTFAGHSGPNCVFGQRPYNNNGYFTLDGVVVDGGGCPGSLINSFANNALGITIQNCEIFGIKGISVGNNVAGIFIQGATGAVIRNNYFHDIHKPVQPDHCHGYEEYNCVGTQFLNNTIANCDTGLDGKVGSAGATVAFNYFYNCPTGAVQGFDGAEGNPNSPGTPNTVHHNIIDSCGGLHVCDVNNATSQGLVWYNNTAFDTRAGSICSLDLRTASSRLVQCYNNISVATSNSSGPYMGTIAFSVGGCTVLDYNAYYLNSYESGWGLSGNATYSSLTAWQSACGAETHSRVGDPLFTTKIVPGGGPRQFILSAASPFKGAGRTNGQSTGAPCDMGAWGNGATSIGCSFLSGPVPAAPTLSVS